MGHNRNLADYAHHFDGTHIDLGSGNIETEGVVTYEDVTNVDAIGIVTARAGVKVPDNQKVLLGTGDDLEIFHDGTNTHISNSTGGLFINQYLDDGDIFLRTDDGSGGFTNYLFCDGSEGEVKLYHYGNEKLKTSSTGATVTGTLVSELDLNAISSSISDTAVDVFVYDTRKDSDGGAWRKRTQHTSWYNETLGTATRGSRKEFPAVAVLVLQGTVFTIYDGDDPDLPMWMVFNKASNSYFSVTTNSCVTALNGKIVSGGNASNDRLRVIDFLLDNELEYSHTSGQRTHLSPISGRNGTAGFTAYDSSLPGIVNRYVNDVAMTVLPNAPIDDATGLPVPTIAVATNGGVSIIKDDGTVISSTSNTSYPIEEISIFSSGELYHRQGSGSNEGVCFNNPYTRISGINLGTFANSSTFWYATDGVGNSSNYLGYSSVPPNAITTPTQSSLNIGDNRGLTFVDVNKSSLNNGMVAYATTSYNTGYMHGEIKGAFLSDTDTTNVSANTLNAVNAFDGTFASSTGWTADSDWSISGGVATCNGNNSGRFIYPTNDRWSYGRSVVVEITVTAYTSGTLSISYSTGGATSGTNMTATGTYKFVNLTTGNELIYIRSDSFVGSIDNVKIYYTEEDRSVNNNGLILYGTITKSAVATGAELVGYSGFTGSSYMTYNASNMNFGTGDFSVSVWCIPSTDQSNEFILELDNASAGRFYLLVTNSTTKRLYVPWDTDIAGSELTAGQWNHVVVGRKSGYGFVYVNNRWISDGYKPWTVDLQGNGYGTISNYSGGVTNDYAWSGSLALLRISGTAPSAEQVSKMYEDEKVLFQENAKVTLYGSSDAVTALGYDEDTELLHVGTSSGRSDFQGLRRINNTTTAVTTAISASDELIAEQ